MPRNLQMETKTHVYVTQLSSRDMTYHLPSSKRYSSSKFPSTTLSTCNMQLQKSTTLYNSRNIQPIKCGRPWIKLHVTVPKKLTLYYYYYYYYYYFFFTPGSKDPGG